MADARAVADRPRPQPRRRPLPPLVHAVDPAGPGAGRGLLRLRRLDLRGLLRHAGRPHRDLRRGRALRRRGPGRRPHDVLRPRLERLELDRAADAGPGAPRRARARRAQHPPLGHQRAEGLRAGLPLPARRRTSRASRRCCRRASTQVARGPGRATPRRSRSSTRRPTYEGLAANTRGDRRRRSTPPRPTAMVIVDEAWGGHLHFHPAAAARARWPSGADVCVQSTHKLAGGLQQTGLIHWREGRVDSELMEEAYREYVTTSPSYHLLASADAAVRTLAAEGEAALGRAHRAHPGAQDAAARRAARPRPPRRRRRGWRRCGDHVAGVRPRQDDGRPVALRAVGLRGRSTRSSSAAIVIEKAGVQTITLITTFQLAPDAVDDTVERARRHPRRRGPARRRARADGRPTRSAPSTTGR